MEQKNCLNCDAPVSGDFCSNCGQRTSTHRLTPRHFIVHDLIHGVWHMDKGVLFTLKEVFVRPGLAAKDYIAGKRIRYYNIFYLLLLIIAIDFLVVGYNKEQLYSAPSVVFDDKKTGLADFATKYIKYFIFSVIPIFALNSWMLFRKLKLNYIEHSIIAGFSVLGFMIILLFRDLFLTLFNQEHGYVSLIVSLIAFIFPVWVYYLATKTNYRALGFSWRIICFYLFFIVEIMTAILIYGFLYTLFVFGID